MSFGSKVYYYLHRVIKFIKIFAMIAGPGIIVMVADNDAGGITTYAVTGARYGYSLLWFLVILGPIAYFIQEMTVRLGAITKRGHAEAIFDSFGSFWGWFSLLDLAFTNFLTMITEFIGMTAALSIFGVPAWITIILCWAIMGFMIIQGRYWTWEKIAMLLCIVNLIYVPAAFLIHPSVSNILGGMIPQLPKGGITNDFFFLLMANIGTTIAPWMVFFQQSTVVDKGVAEKDLKWSRLDTAIGAVLTVIVAVFVIAVTGKLLYGVNIQSAAEAAIKLMPINKYVGTLVAIGLFDAGLLGAVCISLASSWAFGEVFGWAHSLNKKVREAPWFYAYYFAMLFFAGIVVIIPNAPLILITLFVQVAATTLLPAALVFLLLLLNNEDLMGKYKNSLFENIVDWSIVVGLIIISTGYTASVVFPNLLQ